MALERRRPLPAGRYWFDVVPGNQLQWDLWLAGMANVPSVTIEHIEHYEAVSGVPGVPNSPARDFVIFSLSQPNVAWEVAGLASPTIAPDSVQSASDTADVPPPEPDALDRLRATTDAIGTGAKVGIALVAVAAVIAILKR
jgi:hypothetical protein